jgi:hypothetical protein
MLDPNFLLSSSHLLGGDVATVGGSNESSVHLRPDGIWELVVTNEVTYISTCLGHGGGLASTTFI